MTLRDVEEARRGLRIGVGEEAEDRRVLMFLVSSVLMKLHKPAVLNVQRVLYK